MLMPDASEAVAPSTLAAALRWPAGVERSIEKRINAKDEAATAADWLLAHHAAGQAWRDMVVLAPGKRNWRDPVAAALDDRAIPYRMLLGDPTRETERAGDHVHVMTLHAVEGLVFADVAVLGAGDLPWKTQTLDEVTRLLQTAVMHATHALLVLHSKPSALVEVVHAA